MNEELRDDLSDTLTAYLAGWKTLLDCYVWLASVDWDDPTLEADGQKTLGTFELLSTDVLEGFRDEVEFAQEASDFVASVTRSRYVVPRSQVAVASSSSNSMVQAIASATISPSTVQI